MNIPDFLTEIELISLENQAEINRGFGELPANKYHELVTFTCSVGERVLIEYGTTEESKLVKNILLNLVYEKLIESRPKWATNKRFSDSYLIYRCRYFLRDICTAINGSPNFDYTLFHFYDKDLRVGFDERLFFGDQAETRYTSNEYFNQLMNTITFKTYHFINSYLLEHVPSIRKSPRRSAD